jgi:hypothetical protein
MMLLLLYLIRLVLVALVQSLKVSLGCGIWTAGTATSLFNGSRAFDKPLLKGNEVEFDEAGLEATILMILNAALAKH